jgi:hypothetical protein
MRPVDFPDWINDFSPMIGSNVILVTMHLTTTLTGCGGALVR